MYVDFRSDGPAPRPWRPKPAGRRLTRPQEKLLGWLVGINLVLLLVAPLGGATLVEAIVALLRG